MWDVSSSCRIDEDWKRLRISSKPFLSNWQNRSSGTCNTFCTVGGRDWDIWHRLLFDSCQQSVRISVFFGLGNVISSSTWNFSRLSASWKNIVKRGEAVACGSITDEEEQTLYVQNRKLNHSCHIRLTVRMKSEVRTEECDDERDALSVPKHPKGPSKPVG